MIQCSPFFLVNFATNLDLPIAKSTLSQMVINNRVTFQVRHNFVQTNKNIMLKTSAACWLFWEQFSITQEEITVSIKRAIQKNHCKN